MTVLTPEDRRELEEACETHFEELTTRLIDIDSSNDEHDLAEQKFICDRRARIDAIRCLLATGEHLEIP